MSDIPMTLDQKRAYDKALGKIESCRLEQGQRLNLCGIGLSHLPPEIGQLTELLSLELARNYLSSLPSEIEELKRLRHINLASNLFLGMP
jgi:Leucine-rich repeat (LRR) protein